MTSAYRVCCIGNAIVDLLVEVEDEFLVKNGLAKGAMTLIDETQAGVLTSLVPDAAICSGGSAANTAAGLAALAGKIEGYEGKQAVCYIGKVRNDSLGDAFRDDLKSIGVTYPTPAATTGAATARCFVFVTPDGERTMQTFLGICSEVREADIDSERIRASDVLYVEGYLWDQPETKLAIRKAFATAKDAGRKVAFTLSDAFCVDRHRHDFLGLLPGLDLLFANESEVKSLFQTSDFDTALSHLRGLVPLATITRSEKGSVVITGSETIAAEAAPIAKLVDTTGAGDLYAAGFLDGFTRELSLADCAMQGNIAAGRIIQKLGARL